MVCDTVVPQGVQGSSGGKQAGRTGPERGGQSALDALSPKKMLKILGTKPHPGQTPLYGVAETYLGILFPRPGQIQVCEI